MNKVFSLSIIVVLMSFCNASAMERGEVVNPVNNTSVCPPLRYKESFKRQRQVRNRVQGNNRNVRRKLEATLALYEQDLGEGAYPANDDF